jgi:hypothetical protein
VEEQGMRITVIGAFLVLVGIALILAMLRFLFGQDGPEATS